METDTNPTQQGIFDNFRANNQNLISTNQLETANPLTLPTSGQTAIPDSLTQFTQITPGTQRRQEQLQQGQETNAGTLNEIFSGLTTLGTRGATQSKLEDQAGIGTLSTELTDIENQLRTKDLEFRRQRESIQKEAGLTSAQRQARLADVARGQASELADLEVIRQARSNSLTNAQSLIDKKVELKFADVQANVDALKFVYNENKETLTKEQDRLLNETIRKEERAFGIAKEQYTQTESEKIQLVRNAQANGASNQVMSAIMQSKSIEEAYKNAGRFGVSIDDKIKKAQLDKIRSELPVDLPEAEKEKAIVIADKINAFDSILSNKLGLKLSVGPTGLNRMAGAIDLTSGGIGAKQEFIASVEQLVSEETLNSLINAKAKGATFGALSEGELALLKQTASKIGKWSKEKNGKVVGYEAPESAFIQELNTLKNLQIKAYEKATGTTYQKQPAFQVNPQTGNVIINAEQDDESFWSN